MQRVVVIVIGLIVGVGAIYFGIKELRSKPELVPAGPDRQDVADGARTVTIRIAGKQFRPDGVSVREGQTVRWVNDDDFEHNVTKTGGPGEEFDSERIASDDVYERSFVDRGEVTFVCEIHPEMKGAVSVFDN